MITTTHRGILAASVAAAVGISVLGGVTAANADTAASSAPSSSSGTSPSHTHARLTAAERTDLRNIEHAVPKEFRTALRAAEHHRTNTERHTALEAVLSKAGHGTYGSTVRTVLEDLRSAGASAYPPKAVTRAKAIEAGRRTAIDRDLRLVLHRALDGRYGTTLQHELETLGSGLPAAPAAGHRSGATTPSASPTAGA